MNARSLLDKSGSAALVLLCLAIIASSLLRADWAARHWDSTYDEYWHLLWSERALLDANFEREYSNFVATTPVSMLNAAARHQSRLANSADGAAHSHASRIPTMFAYAMLLAAVFGIGRSLMSAQAALVATTITALDPNLLTHASLATVDIYFAVVTLAFIYQSIRLYRYPGLREALLLGVIIGLGFVVKLSTVLFFPVLGLVLFSAAARLGAEHFILRFLKFGLAGVAAASFVVCAAYQFRDVGFFLKDLTLYSGFMTAMQKEWPYLFFLLPASFIESFDQTLSFERVMQWNTVIFDQFISDGAWYYFPVTWFFKTPVAMLMLVALAAWYARPSWLRQGRPARVPAPDTAPDSVDASDSARPVLWIVLLQWTVFFLYFNFVFRTHVGLRYILMCLPILYLLCVHVLQHHLRARWQAALLPACLVLALLEQLPYRENILSFSNAFLPDKKNAWFFLTDSNIDWGQNYSAVLAQAAQEYPDAVLNPAHIMPGQNLIRLNFLTGVFHNFQQHRWARDNLEPERHLQHTHLLYDVSLPQFTEFLNIENTMDPIRNLEDCEGNVVSSLPYEFVAPATGDATLCIDAGVGNYRIRVARGWGVIGHFRGAGCSGYPMETLKYAIFALREPRGRLCLSSNEIGTVWEVTRQE